MSISLLDHGFEKTNVMHIPNGSDFSVWRLKTEDDEPLFGVYKYEGLIETSTCLKSAIAICDFVNRIHQETTLFTFIRPSGTLVFCNIDNVTLQRNFNLLNEMLHKKVRELRASERAGEPVVEVFVEQTFTDVCYIPARIETEEDATDWLRDKGTIPEFQNEGTFSFPELKK